MIIKKSLGEGRYLPMVKRGQSVLYSRCLRKIQRIFNKIGSLNGNPSFLTVGNIFLLPRTLLVILRFLG